MRYCEGQFLEVAQRHGLCRPSSSVLSLKDILELNASVVRFCMILIPENPSCAPHVLGTLSGLKCSPACLRCCWRDDFLTGSCCADPGEV